MQGRPAACTPRSGFCCAAAARDGVMAGGNLANQSRFERATERSSEIKGEASQGICAGLPCRAGDPGTAVPTSRADDVHLRQVDRVPQTVRGEPVAVPGPTAGRASGRAASMSTMSIRCLSEWEVSPRAHCWPNPAREVRAEVHRAPPRMGYRPSVASSLGLGGETRTRTLAALRGRGQHAGPIWGFADPGSRHPLTLGLRMGACRSLLT